MTSDITAEDRERDGREGDGREHVVVYEDGKPYTFPAQPSLTAEDRDCIQADLDDERARLTRLQDVEPLKRLEGVRRAFVEAKERYIARLERMLEEG